MIFSLLFIGSLMVGCDKADISETRKTDENVSPRKKVSGTNYYSVTQWSNTDVNALGLKELLAQIVEYQKTNEPYYSVIQVNANINCGNATNIEIPSYTTISGSGTSYGVGGKTITAYTPRTCCLFVVNGEYVTIEGLIIKGPWSSYNANSIWSQACGIAFNGNANYGKVQNCDISGFPGAAIIFTSLNNIVYANSIHNNYMIFINARGVDETLGYGVEVKDGGVVEVMYNLFDNNQHSIAGAGYNLINYNESGYEAHHNTVRDTDKKMRSHHFDMHGNYLNCYAGRIISIHHNAFYYSARSNGWWPSAIMIRGNPQVSAEVYNNSFVNDPNINSAVRQLHEVTCVSAFVNMSVHDNICNGYYTTDPWIPGQ